MSFLARYWNAVERAVSDTGMNPGDIIVDITEVYKNTEEPNVTEPQIEDIIKPQSPNRPNQDGSISRYKTDFAAREALARRSARPSEDCDELEKIQNTATKKPRVKVRGCIDEHETRGTTGTRASKKASREDRVRKKKQLRKLGGGRKVRVTIDEVKLNGSSIWSAR